MAITLINSHVDECLSLGALAESEEAAIPDDLHDDVDDDENDYEDDEDVVLAPSNSRRPAAPSAAAFASRRR
jgi:hypothetical protein